MNLTGPDVIIAWNRVTTDVFIVTSGDGEYETLDSSNATDNNISDVPNSTIEEYSEENNHHAIPPLCLLIIVTVVCNLTLAVVVAIEKRMHKLANAYIFAVACSDMLNGCGPMVWMMQYTVFGKWTLNIGYCYLAAFLDQVVPMIDMSLIFLMAFDRYTAIMNPLEYSKPTRKITISIQISLAYAIPVILWIPPLILYGNEYVPYGECFIDIHIPAGNIIVIAQLMGTYFVVFFATSYLYGRCVWALWLQYFKVQPRLLEGTSNRKDTHVVGNKVSVVNTSQSNNEKSVIEGKSITSVSLSLAEHSGQSTEKLTPVGSAVRPQVVHSDQSSKRRNDLVRSLRNVGIYALVYSVLIMPYAAADLVNYFCLYIHGTDCVDFSTGNTLFMFWMPYFQSTLHPILYALTQREFRSAAKKLLRKIQRFLCRCCNPN